MEKKRKKKEWKMKKKKLSPVKKFKKKLWFLQYQNKQDHNNPVEVEEIITKTFKKILFFNHSVSFETISI